jgi:hypothetical protein
VHAEGRLKEYRDPVTDFRYKAFISYSHRDERWARWLQRALESYHVPRRLVGKQGKFGEIPARLTPVFRDREDLSSAASLTDSVRHEIAAAETLVVICSPAAAQSRWVNEEVSAFAALGRTDRIYTLIVEGDPQAADPAEQCFPKVLLEDQGSGAPEPLAADARKWADGKVLAKLKLVAGILGIRLDDLRQREMQRRRRKWVLSSVTVAAVVLLTTILSITAISSRKAAEQRRANTEELLGYMLGSLENLHPVSGLDVLDDDQLEMIQLAEQEGFPSMSEELLLEKALDWRQAGMAARDSGDSKGAMSAFSRSLAALVHLYQRDTRNYENLFELGQAEFWVGYIHLDNGDLDQAEESSTRYGVITRRLINADPKNAENVLELSYTLTNLVFIENAREGADIDKAILLMQAALEYNQVAMVLEPDDQLYVLEMAETQANLADTWLGVCNLGKAYQFREENAAIVKQLLEQKPDDPELQKKLAFSSAGNAKVQQQLGLNDYALENLRVSEVLLAGLAREHPENERYGWERLIKLQRISQILIDTERLDEAADLITQADAFMVGDTVKADALPPWKTQARASVLITRAELSRRRGLEEEARGFNLQAIHALAASVSESPAFARSRNSLALALFQYWQLNGEPPPAGWLALVDDYSLSEPPVRSCGHAELAARQAVMQGEIPTARYYTDYLLGKGFYEPGFVRFCRAYGLCN